MPFYQQGTARFEVPIAVGVTPQWYTVPFSVSAAILRVNYVSLGMTGGNVNCLLNLYFAPLAANMRTTPPTLMLTHNIAAGVRTSRIALDDDYIIYGGDYVLIWVFTYAAPPANPLYGPAMAVSGEANTRVTTLTGGAFNPAVGMNFDETPTAGAYNDATVFTTPNFPYGIPWSELYYCGLAAGEAVPGGEGGGGVPPATTVRLEPKKVGTTA